MDFYEFKVVKQIMQNIRKQIIVAHLCILYYKTFNDLVSSNSLETIGDHDLISSLQKCSLKMTPICLQSSYDYYDGGGEFLCYIQEPPTAERRQRRCECQTASTGPRLVFSCSDCTVQIVQCSALMLFSVQLFSLHGRLFGLGTLFVATRPDLK